MLLPHLSVAAAGFLVYLSMPTSTLADPSVPIVLHCGDLPLDKNDVYGAFQDLSTRTNNDQLKYWLERKSSAFGYAGGAEFYLCNNAGRKRYYTMDQPALDEIINSYEYCGSKSFWKMSGDKWSFGVDKAGNGECGF